MIQVVVSVVVALLCLVLFLFFLKPSKSAASKSLLQEQGSMAGLAAVYENLDLLFSRDDYDALCTNVKLAGVQKQYWRGRQTLVLAWLRDLEKDAYVAWQFRRFLVLSGLPATFQQEVLFAFLACFATVYLKLARAAAYVAGPFFLSKVLRTARWPVAQLCIRGTKLLADLPSESRTQIQSDWAKQVAALGLT